MARSKQTVTGLQITSSAPRIGYKNILSKRLRRYRNRTKKSLVSIQKSSSETKVLLKVLFFNVKEFTLIKKVLSFQYIKEFHLNVSLFY